MTSVAPRDERRLSLGEALVLGTLALAAAGTWISLMLAHAGIHDGWLVVLLTAAAGGALAALLRFSPLPQISLDWSELGVLALVGGIALFLAWPGFPYGVADKDPGVYVAHGEGIARTGDYEFTDPIMVEDLPRSDFLPGARFPGIWIADAAVGRIVPQFFHLYPAALATAHDVAGLTGLVNLNVGFAVLSALALTLAVRRAVGPTAGLAAGLLLATNFLQTWHAKYPTTEILTQMLFVGAILGVAVSLDTRWRLPAGMAGTFTGLTLLARPDSVLIVVPVIGVGAAILALKAWDRRCTWFAVGLALTVPHLAWQTYNTAERYALGVGVPSETRFVLFIGALVTGVVVWRCFLHDRAVRLIDSLDGRRLMRWGGYAVAAAGFALVAVGFARPWLFGEAFLTTRGQVIRSYDEINLERLSWFFTVPGVVLVAVGLAVVALQKWRAKVWTLLIPAVVIMPVYLSHSRVSPRLMWSTRRWVPVVVVGVVVLIAIAVAAAMTWEGRWRDRVRGAGLLALAGIVVFGAQQSWDLRDHRELTGSFEIVDEVASVAGDDPAVFLWEHPSSSGPDLFHPSRVLGAPLWFRTGHASTIIAEDFTPSDLDAYRDAFPDARIFLVTKSDRPQPSLETVPFVRVLESERVLPLWEETFTEPPDDAKSITMRLTVWAVPS